jgi:hypothetical protein
MRAPMTSSARAGSLALVHRRDRRAGPRYCPSIEDKIHRFADRDSHQVFLEPEGLDDTLVYPNGLSTSLPTDVQLAMMRSMEGLEQVGDRRARLCRGIRSYRSARLRPAWSAQPAGPLLRRPDQRHHRV